MTLSWFGRQGPIESASSNRAIGRASISWGSEGALRRGGAAAMMSVFMGLGLGRVFARRGAGDPSGAPDWTGTSGPGTIPGMRHALTAVLLAGLTACATTTTPALRPDGDPERAAILAVVERSFDAIQAQGEEGARIWREVLLDRGSMSSVRTRDGARTTSGRSFAEHLERTENAEPGPSYLERMWDQTVLVEGDAAVVWTPYDFWLGGDFSHGGVDVITLLRTDEGWKIASFVWSVQSPDFESLLPPGAAD